MTMTWTELLTFAGTAGVLSAVLTQIFSMLGGLWTARRRSGHLALRLAVQFEIYGSKCGQAVSDASTYMGTNPHDEGVICFAPDFPDLPTSSEAWEHLSGSLAHRVLAFPFLVADNNRGVSDFHNVTGEIDTDGTTLNVIELGLKAFILGKDLRYAYGLPQFEELEGIIGWMEPQATKLRGEIAAYEERQRKHHAEMMAKLPKAQPSQS